MSLFPLHRRGARQQIIFSFLLATRGTGVVGSLHRLIMFFTWPHARASFAICSLHEVRNETDGRTDTSSSERERGCLIFPPVKRARALERISEVGQNAAPWAVGKRMRKDRRKASFATPSRIRMDDVGRANSFCASTFPACVGNNSTQLPQEYAEHAEPVLLSPTHEGSKAL